MENTALERDFLNYFILKEMPLSNKDIAYWNRIKVKASSFNLNIINDDSIRDRVLQLLSSREYRNIDMGIENIYTKIELHLSDGVFNVDPDRWFEMHTKKIDYLLKVENIVESGLISKLDEFIFTNLVILLIASLIWVLSLILTY